MYWKPQWENNWDRYFLTIKGDALRISVKGMDHQQPPKLVVTDSATSGGFVNDNIRQQKSRAIDMRLYWVRNRVRQGHYLVYWERGKDKLANYFIKHHPNKHHRATRGTYLVPTVDSSKNACYQVHSNLQGCVKSPPTQETGNGQKMSPPPKNRRRTKRDRRVTRYRRQ